MPMRDFMKFRNALGRVLQKEKEAMEAARS